MPTSTILLNYQERIFSLQATAAQLRYGQIVALCVGVALLALMVLFSYFALIRKSMPLPSALVPLPLAIYAGHAGRQRNRDLLKVLRLETFYQRGVERLDGRWTGNGVTGDEFVPQEHPYAQDLNVVGEGSLFQLLATCRTETGRRRLAEFLLGRASLAEVRRRQDAIRELRQNCPLREELHLLGEYSFQQSNSRTIIEWLDSPVLTVPHWLRALALALSLSVIALFLAGRGTTLGFGALGFYLACVLLLSGALALRYRKRFLEVLPVLRDLGMELTVLRAGLALLQRQNFHSSSLSELSACAVKGNAAQTIQRLERLTRVLLERNKEWFYHVSRAVLLGTQVFWAIEAWRARHGAAMRRWLSAWGEFEALIALANYAYEHPENTFPELLASGVTELRSEGMGHPLLPGNACVRNDLLLNERTRFYVISGSNMAGKSTLLRTIGLNVVLAYAGAPVCAHRMTLSQLTLCASLALQDSLLNGKSKFLAEVERIKQVLEVTPAAGPVLFLIDEILSGTNSKDRRVASEAILRALIQRGAIGALSTHDLALTELAELPDLFGQNIHMGSKDDHDPLNFDYIVKPGVTKQSSALAIARLAGVCP